MEFLRGLLGEYLHSERLDLLPLAVLRAHAEETLRMMQPGEAAAGIRDTIADWVDEDQDDSHSAWRPSAVLQAAKPEPAEDARDILLRRIGLFWQGQRT